MLADDTLHRIVVNYPAHPDAVRGIGPRSRTGAVPAGRCARTSRMSDGWDQQRYMSQGERRREGRPDLTLFGYPAVVLVQLELPDGETLEVKNPLTGPPPAELDPHAIQAAIASHLRGER